MQIVAIENCSIFLQQNWLQLFEDTQSHMQGALMILRRVMCLFVILGFSHRQYGKVGHFVSDR